VEVVVLDLPAGDVIGRGSYYGGPDYEFVVAADGHRASRGQALFPVSLRPWMRIGRTTSPNSEINKPRTENNQASRGQT